MWKDDAQGCKEQLYFYQHNEYHFLENIPRAKTNFTTSPQVFQYLKFLKLNFLNSKKFSKSAAHWSIISLYTVKLGGLVIILLSFFWKSHYLDRSQEIRSYLH